MIDMKEVDAVEEPMVALTIDVVIEDPNLETIAEGWVNREHVYLWRDDFWLVAVNRYGKRLLRHDAPATGSLSAALIPSFLGPQATKKTIIIHRLGKPNACSNLDAED